MFLNVKAFFYRASGGCRTRTRFFGEQDFKSCVSTGSTTEAWLCSVSGMWRIPKISMEYDARAWKKKKPIRIKRRMGMNLSGRRDSNPRPSPWQGDALPAELLPHLFPFGSANIGQSHKEKKSGHLYFGV
jgi:hypothetical protein